MSERKCAQCGLVNLAVHDACRRCGWTLTEVPPAEPRPSRAVVQGRGIGRRLLWLVGVTVVLVFLWSRSLLVTSQDIDASQRQAVMLAIEQLADAGFSREVLVLRHFANYRATDNWWNLYLGHREAYAATNFPLGVVTLYAPFFTVAVDDTERAAILLHEAQHLWGSGEEVALERAWRAKGRVGWTRDKYGRTKVWLNTAEWTAAAAPMLFQCGPDGHADCTEGQ